MPPVRRGARQGGDPGRGSSPRTRLVKRPAAEGRSRRRADLHRPGRDGKVGEADRKRRQSRRGRRCPAGTGKGRRRRGFEIGAGGYLEVEVRICEAGRWRARATTVASSVSRSGHKGLRREERADRVSSLSQTPVR
ncbi:hornerin-like [Iris pallida]|uniref:Hornerin-like n=1 Tax=Iris pallida TaxID=29817 RepID=A0AAX6EEF5_IRIPA|nr:hornerin-like [Iris pallida]